MNGGTGGKGGQDGDIEGEGAGRKEGRAGERDRVNWNHVDPVGVNNERP